MEPDERQSIIALVDDDPLEARLVEHGFRKVGEMSKFIHFPSGQHFLDYLNSGDHEPLTLVLLDLKMPQMDGWEVLSKLTSLGKSGMPVVVFSSSSHPGDISRSYELGAAGFVTKPILREEYLRTLKATADFWVRLNRPLTR